MFSEQIIGTSNIWRFANGDYKEHRHSASSRVTTLYIWDWKHQFRRDVLDNKIRKINLLAEQYENFQFFCISSSFFINNFAWYVTLVQINGGLGSLIYWLLVDYSFQSDFLRQTGDKPFPLTKESCQTKEIVKYHPLTRKGTTSEVLNTNKEKG